MFHGKYQSATVVTGAEAEFVANLDETVLSSEPGLPLFSFINATDLGGGLKLRIGLTFVRITAPFPMGPFNDTALWIPVPTAVDAGLVDPETAANAMGNAPSQNVSAARFETELARDAALTQEDYDRAGDKALQDGVDVWTEAPDRVGDFLSGAADAAGRGVGKVAAIAANAAGKALGSGAKGFLTGIGPWGVAVIILALALLAVPAVKALRR